MWTTAIYGIKPPAGLAGGGPFYLRSISNNSRIRSLSRTIVMEAPDAPPARTTCRVPAKQVGSSRIG